jgi:hypothetical protein
VEEFFTKLRILLGAEVALAKLEARRAGRQMALVGVSIVLVGLALLAVNTAAFFYLDELMESRAGAALVVALADGLLAYLVLQRASTVKSGPEAEAARQLSELSRAQLESDMRTFDRELGSILDGLRALTGTGVTVASTVLSAIGGFTRRRRRRS